MTGKKPAAKGKTIKDKKTGYSYKVTSASVKSPKVSLKSVPKKTKTLKIPASVTIGGVKYEVTGIVAKACKNRTKLKSVVIPKTVKSIGSQAFYGCGKLKTITCKSKKLTKKKVGAKAFTGIAAKAVFKAPSGKKITYKAFLFKKGFPKTGKIK